MRVWRGRMCERRFARTIALWRGTAVSWWSPVLGAALLVAACDLPTKPPKLQNRLLLGAQTISVPVTDLLPGSVHVIGSTFRVQLAPANLALRTLAEMCGASCVAQPGVEVRKPAFRDSSEVRLSLPSDVVGATLSGGVIEVALTHGLAFDPLRPAGAEQAGSIRVRARSGGREIGTVVLDEPFPSGATLRGTLPLLPGPVAGEVFVSVVVHSPEGAPIPSEWLRSGAVALAGTVTPLQVIATDARVHVAAKQVSVEHVEVDVSGIDDSVIRRVRAGVVRITIANPFAVTGTLELRLQRSGVDVRRIVQLAPDRQTARLELTEAELHMLLGHKLTMSLDGAVTGESDAVAVLPEQKIGITTSLELVLEIG